VEALKHETINTLVEKLARYLSRENINVSSCEVREKKSKFEVYLKLDKNIAELSTVKIIINKNKDKIRVFTGKTSFDLRLKRFIKRELSRMADNP
jgi:hypothetical protein